jgi:phosphate transport system substrate-binding protein
MRTISVALMGLLVVATAPFAAAQKLNACGATFPDPIYKKWFSVYGKAHQGAQINYEANGSGGGVKGVTDGTVDFGASDMPMTDQELAAVKSGKILHFPTVLGAVVPIYNLPGVAQELKFSGPVLADIFLGTISKWSDSRIAAENPGVKLPNEDIVVVHRTDGSGTTFVWTDYLTKVSPEWKSKVGAAKSVSWPKGLGGAQSAGVTGLVKQNPNSISYVELLYALQNKIGYGQVKNSAGNFVKADVATVTEAAAGAAKNMPADFRVSITNPPGKSAYPISTFTWLLIPSRFSDPAKARQVKEMLHWVLTDGQVLCAGLSYAPLPQAVVTKEEKQIDAIH